MNALGFLDRAQVRDVLALYLAGLVTFKPAPNHPEAQPNKMFEYMSAGIPVIASDFPLWREIVEATRADRSSILSIRQPSPRPSIGWSRTRRMGENGRRAVMER